MKICGKRRSAALQWRATEYSLHSICESNLLVSNLWAVSEGRKISAEGCNSPRLISTKKEI